MQIRHGFPKVFGAVILRCLRNAIRKAERDKRLTSDTTHGEQLRNRQLARVECAHMVKAMCEGQSVAQFAFSLGWKPPVWAGDQHDLNRAASEWLDDRWRSAVAGTSESPEQSKEPRLVSIPTTTTNDKGAN